MSAKFTVLVENGLLKTSRYVGTFDSAIEAENYAFAEASRSRRFASFEVWTGTPQRPGKPTYFKLQGTK